MLRRHIRTTRPCPKLDYQRLGPFVIIAGINDTRFRRNLPEHMRLHPVFHSSLLEPCRTSLITNRVVPPPPSVQLADGPEYEVVVILDFKIVHNKLYYLVDWLGYSPTLDNVCDAQALSTTFIETIQTNPTLQI